MNRWRGLTALLLAGAALLASSFACHSYERHERDGVRVHVDAPGGPYDVDVQYDDDD
jgi:hypothetical protein